MTTPVPPTVIRAMTPRSAFGLGFALGCSALAAAAGALCVLPDKAMDQVLRVLERRR